MKQLVIFVEFNLKKIKKILRKKKKHFNNLLQMIVLQKTLSMLMKNVEKRNHMIALVVEKNLPNLAIFANMSLRFMKRKHHLNVNCVIGVSKPKQY